MEGSGWRVRHWTLGLSGLLLGNYSVVNSAIFASWEDVALGWGVPLPGWNALHMSVGWQQRACCTVGSLGGISALAGEHSGWQGACGPDALEQQ